MDRLFCLTAGAMLYVSAPFLTGAIGFRILRWRRAPRSAIHLGIFGSQKLPKGRWSRLGKDLFLFPQVLDLDRSRWGFVIAFHLAGLLLMVGHLRLISEFTPLELALGPQGMERFALFIGVAVGTVLLISLLYFLLSRLTLAGRRSSEPDDFFLLILLLLVVSSGDSMRFFGSVPIGAYREYLNALLSFGPYVPAGLDAPAQRWSLGIHVMSVNMLLFYLPFSKLMHFIGSLPTALIRNEHLWIRSYSNS